VALRDLAIPVLPSRSLAATVRFYAALGFTGGVVGGVDGDGYAILTRGELELHFFSHPKCDPATSHAGCYLRVADVAALHEAFARASLPRFGIPRMDALEHKPSGMLEFAVVDADGNLVRVGQVV
jgi:catechol 2,3-dioxygenase-like lactoylglutathione lyase family enzyme